MSGDTSPTNAVASKHSSHTAAVTTPRWHTPAAVALLLLHGLLAWTSRTFGLITANDDAEYLLLARALRQFAYNDFHLIGAPVHAQYPPGFPAFLALLSLPFGNNFDVFLGAIVLCSVIALALLYDAVRRRCGAGVALIVLALCAVNTELVYFAGHITSESPYMMFTALAVWAVVRESTSTTTAAASPRWVIVAMLGAMGAALTRSIGVTILAALFLLWLLERRYRRALALAVAAGLSTGSWILWTILAPAKVAGRSYIADATFAAGEQQSLAVTLFERLRHNVPEYLKASLPWILPQPTVEGTMIDNIVGALVLVTLLAIGAWLLWKRARVVVLYLATYTGLLAVWPWQATRFLIPVLPFTFWTLVAGAFRLSEIRRWLRPLPLVVAATIIATAVVRDYSLVRVATRCERATAMTSTTCYTREQVGFFAAMKFLRDSSADTSILLTEKDATAGYLTDRRVVLYQRVLREPVTRADSAAVFPELLLSSADYIVLSPLASVFEQRISLLRQHCTRLVVVREFPAMTLVLAVPPDGAAVPPGNACAALQRYEAQPQRPPFRARSPNGLGAETG